jgi:hypothetical protein
MTVVPVPVELLLCYFDALLLCYFPPLRLCCFASGRTSDPELGSIPCSGSFPVRRGGFGKTPQNWTGAGVLVAIPRVSSLPEPKPLHSARRTVPIGPLPSPTVCRFRETHGTHPHARNRPPTRAGRRPPAGHHFIPILIGYVVLTDRLQSSTVVPAPATVHVRTYPYRYAASTSWAKQKNYACWAPSGRTF